jgi:hypothetical protein
MDGPSLEGQHHVQIDSDAAKINASQVEVCRHRFTLSLTNLTIQLIEATGKASLRRSVFFKADSQVLSRFG